MHYFQPALLIAFTAIGTWAPIAALASEPEIADIGNRRELFVDKHLIDRMEGVSLRLHSPRRAEVALRFDKPWEGPYCGYVTVFKDDDRYRMYYRGWPDLKQPELTCYAESKDGVTWTKPDLGLFAFGDGPDAKQNNIVWMKGFGSHNFTPFKDARPDVPADEQYKALSRAPQGTKGLVAFASADGIHWRLMRKEPVLTKGAFDSQNLAFWDPVHKRYVTYYRIFTKGVRAIATATSDDFLTWSEPEPIEVDGPPEHFYTNAITRYYRSPEFLFAFPKRFARSRRLLKEHESAGISEGVFMTSRDGLHFDRTFMQALIRPGREERNWGDRGTMTAWGILPTADDEMSIYFSQHYRFDTHHLKRGVFRVDGIASAHADYEEGELVTKPLRFDGDELRLNFATSATGSVRIEIQDAAGKPIPGHTLADAKELYGDDADKAYSWKSGGDVSPLKGKPVRLRFVLKDADVYAYRFSK